ncbi:hypothetical protein HYPBUDRAFT_103762 [Hyphopichia burtonii NRRL Y-1933]|uniref:Nuclear condensin complex subunit 3 C-terminal domain-containing protein n=1 Tax=Hyphopichia burtonii NRRL Y-1933 TaxID=984485 RepID=A0A1E4RTD1_9ASCO|nr:hypothetical protein HYPBUDRAFT_103762 [Hyphopichia burtonii NRRL Y-1933]ODV70498.1 hypothetical protein HYPBUDRAFT_103762 [Hyphopichia burtonii NRRL Y-1933]
MAPKKRIPSSIQSLEDLAAIKHAMAGVFQDAQLNLTSHRKLVVVLRNIQLRAIELGLQGSFNLTFAKLINLILPLKKGEKAADRIAKFSSAFVSAILKDEQKQREEDGMNDEDHDETPGSEFIEFLVHHLLRGTDAKDKNVRYRVVQLLAYFVNYITEIDEELFQALHYSLRNRLKDKESNVRIQAIVAISRFQFFELADDEENANGYNKKHMNSATKSLLTALENDDVPEVRRAALLNLVKNSDTIPYLLERARDVNSINRRLVYSRILKDIQDFREIDIDLRQKMLTWGLYDRDDSVKQATIRMLNHNWSEVVEDDLLELVENMKIVDNDVSQLAMMHLFENRQAKSMHMVINESDWKELTIEKAFVFRTYYQYCKNNKLHDIIDSNFPELSELAKTLEKYLELRRKTINPKKEMLDDYNSLKRDIDRIDGIIKATYMQKNQLQVESILSNDADTRQSTIAKVKEHDNNITQYFVIKQKKMESLMALDEEYQPFIESLTDLEFIIEQILLIIKEYDFDDIVGNRRMLPIIRNYLTNGALPEKLIEVCTNILRKISTNENDFASLCVEVITDIRDSYLDEFNDNESFHSAASNPYEEEDKQSENGEQQQEKENDENDDDDDEEDDEMVHFSKKRRTDPELPFEVLIQCLMILKHYLILLDGPSSNINQNESLVTTLINPGIASEDFKIKCYAYRCLGLYTLIEKNDAVENLKRLGYVTIRDINPEKLKIIGIEGVFDILATYGVTILDDEPDQGGVDALSLARLFYKLLKNPTFPTLQATVAEGLCKLFLADLLVDFGKGNVSPEDKDEKEDGQAVIENQQEIQLLEGLVLSYFHPNNSHNHELNQTLAFCLPVYAFSHPNHQAKLVEISGDCLYRIFRNEEEDSVQTPSVVINQLINWCDPNNVVNQEAERVSKSTNHFWQAIKFLQVVEQDSPKRVKKVIISNLNKLFIREQLGSNILKGLDVAIEDTKKVIEENKQHDLNYSFDAITERNLEKFQLSIKELIKKAQDIEVNLKLEKEQEENEFDNSRSGEEHQEATDQSPENEDNELHPSEDANDSENTSDSADLSDTKAQEDNKRNKELAEIDQLLANEENIEYDVDISIDQLDSDQN